MSDTPQNLKAIICVTLGFALFSVNDVLVKLLAQSYSIPQTLFWTSCFVCLVLLGYAALVEKKDSFKSRIYGWHILRGLFMAFMILCNIFALVRLQVTDFYAIVFLSPLAISLMSWFFLKDRLKKRQLVTILAGFATVLFMCRPGGGLFNIGALSALMGVSFFSLSTLLVRSRLREENPLLLSANGPAVMLLLALPLMGWFGFALPATPIDWILFMSCGIAAGFGGVFFGLGFQYASSAAIVAPFHYTQMIWGAVLGYLVFQEIPSRDVVLGGIILAGLGVYLIYTETQLRKRRLTEQESLVQHGPV